MAKYSFRSMPAVLMHLIRAASKLDSAAIHQVHCAAFPTGEEARLVALLSERKRALISLVAEISGRVVGHVMFSAVRIEGGPRVSTGAGLAPLAVLPEHQLRGIGASLVRHGLEALRKKECPFA